MSLNVSAHLGELALTLGDLQRQFRSAARIEVGRAVGDALRQFALTAICGPVGNIRPAADPWDDSWQSDWSEDHSERDAEDFAPRISARLVRVQSALILGFGGARWAYLRTRHPGAAVAVGLALILLGLFGGRSAEALLEALSSALALLRDEAVKA
jgi:hypothetical protein